MKYFPLKTAILCLFLIPLLYIATLHFSQKRLNDFYFQSIENIFIGDTEKLLSGNVLIENHIAGNIRKFLNKDFMVRHFGLEIKILITTNKGRIIYPGHFSPDLSVSDFKTGSSPEEAANHNYEMLNQGISVSSVEVQLDHGTFTANMIFVLYFSVAILIFTGMYKAGSMKAQKESDQKKALIDDLKKDEKITWQILKEMEKERQDLFENIKALNKKYEKDKKKSKINEEELFDEIVSLEGQINSFIELKKEKDNEINELKDKIQKYERRKTSKNKRNEFDFIIKRFSSLYQNIEMNKKAVLGLLDLNEDQQIKAEEIILLLDQKPEKVTIKRKVFAGKKHKTASFEVLFSYNGRLYFRNNEKGQVEILVIGTKNTQTKDMEFLHSL